MNSYIIRQPKSGKDYELYYNLRWELLRKPYHQIKGSEMDEYEKKAYHLMITDLSNKVIGVGRLHKIENKSDESIAQIRYMGILDEYQNNGLGTKILSRLEKYAYDNNFNKIILHSRENAINFYKKNGYEVIKKTHILYDSIQHWMMLKNNNLNK